MKKIILICTLCFLLLPACKDILETEPNISKKLLYVKMSQEDSLKLLNMSEVDLGTVSMMKISNQFISIKNTSDLISVKISSIEGKNTSGLFIYSFPQGIPFTIAPNEDTQITQKIGLKFIADVFNVGMYYDTILVNKNSNFIIPVKVNVIY